MEDYTGLGAVAWELYSDEEPGPDQAFFQRIMEQHPGPTLDVGCGTGRLLLPYLQAGLEIEGVEPSADMLAICRRRAAQRGLEPVLYQQTMQSLALLVNDPKNSEQLLPKRVSISTSMSGETASHLVYCS